MQPPSMMPWNHPNIFDSRGPSCFNHSGNFAQGNFNFNNMATKSTGPEYFSLKGIRGSSPTTSLAADLSQNFHIDMRYTTNISPKFK